MSSLWNGTVNPRGPHQRSACWGSAHAFQTTGSGASKVRLITSTRSAGSGFSSFFAAMILLLALNFLDILIEPIEALLPETAVMIDPVGHMPERLGVEPARPPLRIAAADDQSCFFK